MHYETLADLRQAALQQMFKTEACRKALEMALISAALREVSQCDMTLRAKFLETDPAFTAFAEQTKQDFPFIKEVSVIPGTGRDESITKLVFKFG